MLIQEVILENFMSYEYARIPLKQGVNLICGPNGAGKSSVLLGISVALGQSYTERSRKLSNLIRWGKEQARVTLVLDNSPRKGRRPVRKFRKDQLFLTRELRMDGKYWFELENRAATKREVERTLRKFKVDPENLLIIMHQNMSETFTVLSPEEKLRIVEAAVGLEAYRRNVLDAKKKLSRILSEEASVAKLLESSEQTLTYWREQYDRYQQKKQLLLKKRLLQRELTWAEALRKEALKTEIEARLKQREKELQEAEAEGNILQTLLKRLETDREQAKLQQQKLLQETISAEREKTKNETLTQSQNAVFSELQNLTEQNLQKIREWTDTVEEIETANNPIQDTTLLSKITTIRIEGRKLEKAIDEQLHERAEFFKISAENSHTQLRKIDDDLKETVNKMKHLIHDLDEVTDKFIQARVDTAVLDFKKELFEKECRKLKSELRTRQREYEEALRKAEETGRRIAPQKTVSEILDEIRLTDGYLTALGDVSEDIEHMYESYSKIYFDLKEKANIVAENREKTLQEIEVRMKAWKTVMKDLLENVSVKYQRILAQTQALGEVSLTNEHDIEAAGLEVLVGFKGSQLVPLDAYTQSGGERSMATISFLLALQQHVQSPFRAVDEYDIHMDPKNRETIGNLLIDSVQGLDSQYLIITPSQVTFAQRDIHIITVQNLRGSSRVREVVD
jgi:chromosome segregation ATPase